MSGPAVQQARGGRADEYFQSGPQQPVYPPPPQNYQQHNYGPNQQGYAPDQPYQQQDHLAGGAQYDGAGPYGPPPVPGNHPGGEKQTFEQAFKQEKPKWNDLWAAILFLATFAGFIAVSGWTLRGYVVTTGGSSRNNTVGLNRLTVVLMAYVLAVAFVFSLLYLAMVRKFTKQIIWITGILQIVFGIGTAIFYLWAKQYAAGIVFLVFAVFYIICFISWIPRIPFTVVMLQTVIDVSKHHGHVFLTSVIGGAIATAFGAWWAVTLVAIYAKYEPGNASCQEAGGCSKARVIGLIVFITFAGYWISEVLKNVIHVTIAGVYGSWFFLSNSPQGMPKGATRGAFKRSMTTSFGSISFGSLLVALIQLLRQACSVARQNEAAQGNLMGTIFFCILGCFIGLLDWLIQFFNEYAFCYIALYGKAYVPAAKVSFPLLP